MTTSGHPASMPLLSHFATELYDVQPLGVLTPDPSTTINMGPGTPHTLIQGQSSPLGPCLVGAVARPHQHAIVP